MGLVIQMFGWPPNSSSVGEKKNLLLTGALLLLEAALFAFAWSHWFWVSWTILLCVCMGSIGYISLGAIGLQLPMPGPRFLGSDCRPFPRRMAPPLRGDGPA